MYVEDHKSATGRGVGVGNDNLVECSGFQALIREAPVVPLFVV